MSNRTIIEINHDFAHTLDSHTAQRLFVIALRLALASGSDERWQALEHFGFRRITQRHHSDPISIKVGPYEYPVDGPSGAQDRG
jgi:hypothetical protein